MRSIKKVLSTLTFLFLVTTLSQCAKNSNNFDDLLDTTITDIDGNIYSTVKIGNQVWMLENLKTTKFNDGTEITKYNFVDHGINWVNLNTPTAFYQWSDTSDSNNLYDDDLPENFYGAMYNHFAIESGKLAPIGWRIPTEQDFKDLENFLAFNGFFDLEADALKTENGWLTSSGNGSNGAGFNGLPNGYINAFGGQTFAGGITTWATRDVNINTNKRKMINLYNTSKILFVENGIQIGAGIRCIKNQ